MKEIRNILTLLRNCLYGSEEMKLAAIQESTLPTLLSLWPWLLTCVDVLHAALHFLCVLTANCPSACTACCSVVHSRTPTCQSGARGSFTAGLFQHLVRICSQSRNNSQHLAFNVLSNLSLCQEARSMLQKGNFLNQFAKVPLPRPGQAPHPTLQCWLWLLVMLSYSEDGRQLVLRASGSLDVLLDLEERLKPAKDCVAGKHSLKRVPLPPITTLILHNLCFCQAAKAHILASERYISLLIRWLDSDERTQRTAGASALWALLHHSQKAKVSIKNPRMKAKVESALLTVKNEAHAEQSALEEHFFRSLKNISALLNS
uniref:Rotatin n=1 Tax=Eptatretus burgeri TaxID=7764 RepID=A0A8C4NHK0_EPTBU